MKLETIILASALAISMPANAKEYPVYQRSPSKETFGKQWVADVPQIKEDAITDKALKNRVEYEIKTELKGDTLEIHVEKVGFQDFYQDFLVIQTQEQTMYKPQCKALVKPAFGLSLVGGATAIIGLLTVFGGAIAEDEDTEIIGGIMAGGGLAVEAGFGFGVVVPCSKFKPTDNSRTIELSRKIETRLSGSNLYKQRPASNTNVSFYSTDFMFNGNQEITAITDNGGNASVQVTPKHPNFAFTQEGLTSTVYAQQLQQAGYKPNKYMPLLQEAAVPIQYTITIETRAETGNNAKISVPISGYSIPTPAIEKIVMGL